jgi:hypothetical protein
VESRDAEFERSSGYGPRPRPQESTGYGILNRLDTLPPPADYNQRLADALRDAEDRAEQLENDARRSYARGVQAAAALYEQAGAALYEQAGATPSAEYAERLRQAVLAAETVVERNRSESNRFYAMGLRVAAGLYGLPEGNDPATRVRLVQTCKEEGHQRWGDRTQVSAGPRGERATTRTCAGCGTTKTEVFSADGTVLETRYAHPHFWGPR